MNAIVFLCVLAIAVSAIGTAAGTVAFHANLVTSVTDPAVGHIVKFNQVITNVGANYDPHTGIFTCTQAGVHVFSWTMYTEVQWIHTELVRNGAPQAYSMTGDRTWGASSSATGVLNLAVGDRVWVRVSEHYTGADIHGGRSSMFSGYRIP